MRLIAIVLLFWAGVASAQQYKVVPSGDPLNPYKIELVAPPPPPETFEVGTFDEAVQKLRELEGIAPGANATIVTGTPGVTIPTGLCAPDGGPVLVCDPLETLSVTP
jgi:hypothetical protein